MSTREKRIQARWHAARALVVAAFVTLSTLSLAPSVAAQARAGAGFDDDEGLGARDIVSVLAAYDEAGGALDVQVFLAVAPTAAPPTELTAVFSPTDSCALDGAAVITTTTAPGVDPAVLAHPALRSPVGVHRSVEGEGINLSVGDPRLANLGFRCVQVATKSRGGSPATIFDQLAQPILLMEPSSGAAETALDLGGPSPEEPDEAAPGAIAPVARFRVSRATLGGLAARRMTIAARLGAPGSVTASLRLGSRAARTLGTGRIIARGSARSRVAGRLRVVLRPRRSVLPRLAGRRRVRVTLLVGVGAPGGPPTFVRRRLALR